MADPIIITTDDLLRLKYSEDQIEHIFSELISEAGAVGTSDNNRLLLTVANQQIGFKDISELDLGTTVVDEFLITEEIGKFKPFPDPTDGATNVSDAARGLLTKDCDIIEDKYYRGVASGTPLNKVLECALRDFKSVEGGDIVKPSITVEIIPAIDGTPITKENPVEAGSEVTLKYAVKTDPGKFPYGPETGVSWYGLRVSEVVNGTPLSEYIAVSNSDNLNETNCEASFSSFGSKCIVKSPYEATDSDISITVRSEYTGSRNYPYNSDNSINTKPELQISPSSDSEDEYNTKATANIKIPAYVNAAYIANTKINNASNIRSNTSTVQYQTLEALNNVKLIELKDLTIAINTNLNKKIKYLINKDTGVRYNVVKDKTADIPTASTSIKVTYDIYRVSNILKEDGDSTIEFIFEDK